MSIIGVGVDIEEIKRFEPSEVFERLVKRVFSSDEEKYCYAQAKPSRHFAARFAAKEAAVKALRPVLPQLLVTQVEIFKKGDAPEPFVRLLGVDLPPHISLHLSMAHSGAYATAYVVAEWSQSGCHA